ncbi:mCpol domain-containing protein [Actinoplanes sp. TBRC 11911]|uniref:mCpol domain-containing protein n=1 Tax=Actinoplanes sp. TBRC 11911 TaxID=2729386 RepID=UPI00145F12AB|nr:mCpol domain-containing protein [Actinoplanes sp. TBRC 11911]NMO55865.1 mCpol domain-containing protein [Actinoplanes sp. TBRC 11911]
MAKLRPKLSTVEMRDLAWWFSAALVGGGIPNIIVGLPRGLSILIGVATVAAIILTIEYFRNRRRSGVAVFVHLPSPGDKEIGTVALSQVDKWMQSRHRTWFRAGPMRDDLIGRPVSRAEWALKTMRFRLDEAELLAKGDTRLFLYFLARSPDAFALGSLLRNVVPPASRPGLQALSSVLTTNFQVEVKVHQVSIYDGKVTLNETNLSDVMSSPQPERMSEIMIVGKSQLSGTTERLALIVYAASDRDLDDDHRAAFFDDAREAASGKNGTRYLVEADDVCDRTLEVAVDWTALAEGMKRGTSGRTIAALRITWLQYCADQYGRQDVPVRVFLNGSSLVSFAAGAFLPPDSRLVPYDNGAIVTASVPAGSRAAIMAIIDGDDVGQAIENRMLQNDTDGVLDASAAIGGALEVLGRRLSIISGVRQLSFGGDSALFKVEGDSVDSFLRELEISRRRVDFHFSCGYGPDIRSAFIALRSAKTSGKNKTKSFQSL